MKYLKENKKELNEKYGVIKIGLFGSYARGEGKESGDIDIAVEIIREKKNIHTFFALKRELERALGKQVDLGIESAIKPAARKYIEQEIIYA